jgi:hypothetical protein
MAYQFKLVARTIYMNRIKGLDKVIDEHQSDLDLDHDCMELLKMARIYQERGQKEEAEQFYAALVQVLRPDDALAELQI